MNPILKMVLIGVGLATLVVIGVGFLIPSDYEVTRSVTIDATPAHIHPWLADLEKWGDWAPWTGIDPGVAVTYGEIRAGVGAHQSWTSNDASGELTLTRSDPDWGVAYEMSFKGGKFPSLNSLVFRPVGDATEVIWTMDGNVGNNPFDRFMRPMMDPMFGAKFEDGLSRLKLVAEKQTPEPAAESAPDSAAVPR